MLVHLTVKSLDRTLLFHDWTEALALWRRLVAKFDDARAICLMPTHPHVVTEDDHARERLSAVLSGYARWRGHHRGQDAHCWQPQPAVEVLPDADHARRMVRYFLLNPCRGGLCDDPLSWPLSTHRDLVGLGDPKLRVQDPESFHSYVSSDPTTSLVGTPLPTLSSGPASLAAVEAAVGAVLRMEPHEVLGTPHGRRLCVRAAWYRENCDVGALARWVGLSPTGVYKLLRKRPSRARLADEPLLAATVRVIGDPRFGPLVLPERADPTRWSGWKIRGLGRGSSR
jgi:hypothetical protein